MVNVNFKAIFCEMSTYTSVLLNILAKYSEITSFKTNSYLYKHRRLLQKSTYILRQDFIISTVSSSRNSLSTT